MRPILAAGMNYVRIIYFSKKIFPSGWKHISFKTLLMALIFIKMSTFEFTFRCLYHDQRTYLRFL